MFLVKSSLMSIVSSFPDLIVVGGGLAGSEAALQAAQAGLTVNLYEMRPGVETGAHVTTYLAELVCSNSLGSYEIEKASGLLKKELEILGSFLIELAKESAVPAGGALAVDRDLFARRVTDMIQSHPKIRVIREEMTEIPPSPTIIASGPLTSKRLSESIATLTGTKHLYFFDAIAPIIQAESVNMEIAFRGQRYDQADGGQGDYINCPLTKEEYETFVEALISAERIRLKDFEKQIEEGVTAGAKEYFEGCLPIEVMACRGKQSLAFGPMKPIGLFRQNTGKKLYAVVQLRQDNLAGSLYNMVGFQTNLTFPEQKRVFRMIPGLENAIFERFGQMHRNTFIFSPALLEPTLQFKNRPDIFFAGQICGVEGYAGNIATGLLAGKNAARYIQNKTLLRLPSATMIGALCEYITHADEKDFQPMKANFGLLPTIKKLNNGKPGRKERGLMHAERSNQELSAYLKENS